MPRPQSIFCGPGGNQKCAFDVNSRCPIGVLRSSPSTLEEKDVRRCRKNGSPRAGCRPDSGGARNDETHAPLMGEQTREILAEAGYAQAEIEALLAAGVAG